MSSLEAKKMRDTLLLMNFSPSQIVDFLRKGLIKFNILIIV